MQAVTDEQLIRWVADGDTSCLATLFERHHRSVYRFCLQMTRNRPQSEDLVQDVFMKILRKAKSYRSEGTFRAWMFNIVRNVTLDHLRLANRRGATMPSADEEQYVDDRSAEVAASSKQRLQLVAEALASLPESVQEIIWLARFEFDNYEELATALGCKPGAARVRMHRAMQQLAARFETIHGVPIDA